MQNLTNEIRPFKGPDLSNNKIRNDVLNDPPVKLSVQLSTQILDQGNALQFAPQENGLSRIYKRIEEANKNYQGFIKNEALQEIALDLIKNEYVDQAFEVVNTYQDKENVKINFRNIYRTLLKQDYLPTALEVINKLPKNHEKMLGFQYVFKISTKEEYVDKFVETVKKLRNIFQKASIEYIYKKLLNIGYVDKSIEIVSLMENEKEKNCAIEYICEELIRIKDFDKAIKTFEMTSNEDIKEKHLRTICKELIKIKDFDKAIKVLEMSLDENVKEEYIKIICEELIEIKDFDKAIKTVDVVTKSYVKEEIILDVCNKLIQTENSKLIQDRNFDKVIQVAQMIPTEYYRCKIYVSVCKELVEMEEFEKAIELVTLVPNETPKKYFSYKTGWTKPTDFKWIILKDVFDGFLKIGNVKKAIEVALKVQNDNMLEEISSAFTEKYHLEQAPRVHRGILSAQKRIYSLMEISNALKEIKESDLALEILK